LIRAIIHLLGVGHKLFPIIQLPLFFLSLNRIVTKIIINVHIIHQIINELYSHILTIVSVIPVEIQVHVDLVSYIVVIYLTFAYVITFQVKRDQIAQKLAFARMQLVPVHKNFLYIHLILRELSILGREQIIFVFKVFNRAV
jgi:hypothetical protein